MKKIFGILLIIMLTTVCFAQTQIISKTLTTDLVWQAKGAIADTLIKNGTNNYVFYVKEFADYIKVGVSTVKVRGSYVKFKVVYLTSINNYNWVRVDSTTIAGTATNNFGISAKLTTTSPYVRLLASAIDSTQTVRFTYSILTKKN